MNLTYKPFTRLSFAVLTVLFFFTTTSYSTKLKFATSNVVPAAQGSVKVSKDDNGNYELNLNILHLLSQTAFLHQKIFM